MDSRSFDELWGLGFPACPVNLHEECACIYGGGGDGRHAQGKRGSRCILLTVTSFTRDTYQDNKTKGDVL